MCVWRSADGLPRVDGARVELQQVLVNLLVNAVHAMEAAPPERGSSTSKHTPDAGQVVVSVRDRGHGILA